MLKLLKKNKKIVIVILVLLLCVYLYKEHINKKNVENFNNHVSELMFFSAEWCGHCQDFKPVWKNLVKEMNKEPYKNNIILQNYDNEEDSEIFTNYNVTQFPTIIFKKEDGTTIEFEGNRDLDTLMSFIDDNLDM